MRVCKLRLAWKVLRAGLIIGAAVLAFMPATARAQLIDPATLHTGGTTPAGADPVRLLNFDGFVTISQTSNGQNDAIDNPWLLIIGIANGSATLSNSSITSVDGSSNSSLWSLVGSGAQATMTTGQEAYKVLGLSGPGVDKSNSFNNWADADLAQNGITVTSFSLWEFQINTAIPAGGHVDIQFANGALPNGTYVIAEGTNLASGHEFVSQFTNAGLTTNGNHVVPAPASALLAGLGGLGAGVGGMVRRFRRTRLVAA
jgi:hypothetical protein